MLLINNDYNSSSQTQYHNKQPPISKGVLQWLQNQFISISPVQLSITTIQAIWQQLQETKFFLKLLLKINYQYFSQTELMDRCNCTRSKWRTRIGEVLEKYVNYTERKRIARTYRNVLLALDNNNQIHGTSINNSSIIHSNSQESQSSTLPINTFLLSQSHNNNSPFDPYTNNYQFSSLLLKLLLFLITRSQNNQQFISRILTLSKQNQKQLQQNIQWVAEELLQGMTERQQLGVRFNQLKEQNHLLQKDYSQNREYNEKLVHRLERAHKGRAALEKTIHQNTLQKLTLCQSLHHPLDSQSYTSIFRHSINTNSLLHTLLQQKQSKHQQLLSLNKQINQELNSFEGVLQELGKEKKCVKRELNERENESFRLEMRVSLKGNNCSLKKDSKLWNTDRSNRDAHYNIHMLNTQRNSMLLANSHQFPIYNSPFTQMNQSLNMLSKIQQLRQQKQALTNQLTVLKDENGKLRKKQQKNERLFKELSQLYGQGMKLCGDNENSYQVMNEKNNNKDKDKSSKNSQVNRHNSNKVQKQVSRTLLLKGNNSRRYADEGITIG